MHSGHLLRVFVRNVVPPAQTIHSVHPGSRGSLMHSGHPARLTVSSVVLPAQTIHSVHPAPRGGTQPCPPSIPLPKVGAPTQTIHSVHPAPRGSTMHSGHLLRLFVRNVVPPAQTIHSVHPRSRGSTMRSHGPLRPSLAKYGAPWVDDTLGASRAHRAHLMFQLVSCPAYRCHAVCLSGQWCPPRVAMH